MRKLYFDTEFQEYDAKLANGKTLRVLELICIGITDEAGKTFYAVNKDFNREEAEKNEFIRENVLRQLPPEKDWKPLAEIKKDLLNYVGSQHTAFYYWYAPQDCLSLINLLGKDFLHLPKNIDPMPINIAQTFDDKGHPSYLVPNPGSEEHNPLVDAKWAMELDQRLHDPSFLTAEAPRKNAPKPSSKVPRM
jgi:hypothetical protein